MDAIEKKLLEEVADLHGIPEGAYNIRADGKLAGRGTHDELLQTCEVYREIYESQFKKEDAR